MTLKKGYYNRPVTSRNAHKLPIKVCYQRNKYTETPVTYFEVSCQLSKICPMFT